MYMDYENTNERKKIKAKHETEKRKRNVFRQYETCERVNKDKICTIDNDISCIFLPIHRNTVFTIYKVASDRMYM